MLYKSNYLDFLIAACGTIQRAIRTNFRTVLNCTPLITWQFLYIGLDIIYRKVQPIFQDEHDALLQIELLVRTILQRVLGMNV